MNEMTIFESAEFGQIRTTEIDNKIYFNGSDVAKALGYANPRKAIRTHCSHGTKRSIGVQTGFRQDGTPITQKVETTFIPEGDVYRLIVRSKLPTAEKFEAWVFDEVLPTIRKTGGYIPSSPTDDSASIMAKALLIAQKTIDEKDMLLHRQTKLIGEMQPKVEGYNLFLKSAGYVSLNKAAKSMNMGRNRMMRFLREEGILFKDGRDNIAYQRYCEPGYFTVDYNIGRDGVVHAVTKVSAKGVDYIKKLYSKRGII